MVHHKFSIVEKVDNKFQLAIFGIVLILLKILRKGAFSLLLLQGNPPPLSVSCARFVTKFLLTDGRSRISMMTVDSQLMRDPSIEGAERTN